jgi:hypothetical protein
MVARRRLHVTLIRTLPASRQNSDTPDAYKQQVTDCILMATFCTTGMTIQKLCILPTECVWRRFSTNYYPTQHSVPVFITETGCLLRGTNRIFEYSSG